jgi:FHS family Na+ dependent glucose MFS transporter 1
MNQKYSTTATYYLAFILLGMTLAAQGTTLLKLAEHTSSEINEISWIFFFGALGYLIGSYISGRLYDRLPGHQLMSAMLVLMGIIIIFVPLATSLWVLIGILIVLGFATGALDVGCNALMLWLHNEKVAPFMSGLHAFFGVGTFVAPLINERVLSSTGDIHWTYWIFSIAAFPIAFLIWRLPSPQPRAVPAEHKNSALPMLPIAIMVVCFILYVGAEVSYGNWIYAYAVKMGLYSEVTANFLTSAFWGFFTVGRLISIWISTRLRPLTILYLDFVGCLLSMGLMVLFRDSALALRVGSSLLGISFASIFPTFITLAEERIHVTGTITGWFLVGGSLGGMIIPVLIGQAFDRFGPGTMITIVLATIVFNLLALILFTRVSARAQTTGDKIPVEI